VLSIEYVGSSRWSQIEAIERVERGEEVRGREIVRTVDVDDRTGRGASGNNAAAAAAATETAAGSGPYRLIVQDARGTKVVVFAKERIEKVGIGEREGFIGMKMLLKKGVVVRRGIVMLGQAGVKVLGGKVDDWDRSWKKGAKERLTAALSETPN
jgi:RecQ-mediated genome instability protein 1